MSYTVKTVAVSPAKYRIKCPYKMTPQYITIHNTANDASAINEAKYMRNNSRQISFHTVIDDKYVVRCIPYNRNAWHAGDGCGRGNLKSIGIEICYSRSGGHRFTEAEINAAKYTAYLLKQYGWGIERVKRHKDWSGKNCPHRTMDRGWARWLNMVRLYMGNKPVTPKPPTPGSTKHPSPSGIDITYRAYSNGRWWSNITNAGSTRHSNGYSGVIRTPLRALQADITGKFGDSYKIKYRLHKKYRYWFYWRTDKDKDAAGDTYSGDKKSRFDMLQMVLLDKKGNVSKSYQVQYRVYAAGQWWNWITSYNTKDTRGYAGVKGRDIEAVQMRIIKI